MKAKSSIIGFTTMLVVTAWTAPTPVPAPVSKSKTISADLQAQTVFSFLRVHRQGKGATATWGVGKTPGIVGFQVQKTYEDPNDEYANWEDVTTMSNSGARSFKYTDNNVFPGNIHYRVIALRADGSSTYSAIASLRIVKR